MPKGCSQRKPEHTQTLKEPMRYRYGTRDSATAAGFEVLTTDRLSFEFISATPSLVPAWLPVIEMDLSELWWGLGKLLGRPRRLV